MKSLALHMRISTLSPTDDEVDSRREAGTALASAWSKPKGVGAAIERAQQVAAALWCDLPPSALAAEIETAVQVHSSSFLASDRPFEVGICAAVAVSGMLDSKITVEGFSQTDVLATALWSALSFQPPLQDAKREAMRVEILEGVQARAMEASELSRTRTMVDDFGSFAVVDGDEAKTTANFKKATGDTIKALRRNAALDREEIDFLWWTLIARSRVLKKPLQSIDAPVRAVVAGIEAAQHLRRLPCEVHRELVLRSLDANPSLNLNGLIAALGESREKVAAAFSDTSDATARPVVFPLLNAIDTGVVDADGASVERPSEEWGARALLEAGLLRLMATGPTLL
ncbi:GTPase-associated system all-helical protein GASH [Acidovorax sp.]|uniref:GTPase-associated system all-helical protein GASH n=1 Tax=Acidovorax sp. TaxID=1872122 RepID=UPI0025C04522|nr:GTPase-associated system all-helical protein GASH [Acidovorax sp.]